MDKTSMASLRTRLPNFRTEANPRHIRGGYKTLLRNLNICAVLALICCILPALFHPAAMAAYLFSLAKRCCSYYRTIHLLLFTVFALAAVMRRGKRTYLLDFSVYNGEDYMKLTKKRFDWIITHNSCSEESAEFAKRVYSKSRIGDGTMFPPQIMENFPAQIDKQSMADAKFESREVMFKCVSDVLEKAKLQPVQIGFKNCKRRKIFWL
ncbi:3-ketoacyl-CoA synthase [Bonamia ostreae]|uniref:3-ketoacyl-CoA synthase n=1 Tax=Bonamia ostreae TaxID=126728 RepID=A0ABV2AMN0_9EUKA